ncbi:hypothetical protein [Nocardia mangyaensis]|uniref:hypothetical protein n=1 Tax=Nocardia mangyaensis TaxID=2213200 RepID=UPI00267678AD|nr:hypothetical protein [Nocardia mangyaensis]MDO3650068.1 hypothetical protein [Nocardia mangyaensis]
MTRLFAGLCTAAIATATIGLAAPAQAAPAVAPVAEPVAEFAPETGSSAIYNLLMCHLHTISAEVPCRYV